MSAPIIESAHPKSSPPPPAEMLAAFAGDIQPIRTTLMYRLGILLVWVVMVLLPLVYVALIGAVVYFVYWHTVNNTGILTQGRGRGKMFVVLLYLTPLIIGSIMTLFMIKPLFARPAQRGRRRSLSREAEPFLFAFVDRVCHAVHAPPPRQIDVDCDINASASFRRGLWSMLLGNDLVLTIGMPLAAGLTLRQFAGVLAHEFGHFAQGAGMRLTYVIRSISFWFTRVVYERDSLDAWLESAASSVDLRIGWVLHLARLFVWLSRRILWVLMIVGHGVAGYMLRQMEFDADRHEARLSGSDVFASTARRLIELNYANLGARHDLGQFYREGRLGDDLPRLIAIHGGELPREAVAQIDETLEKSETGIFDTHPSDKERIENARRENAPGIFRVEQPTAVLFRDIAELNRGVTLDFYHEIFGETFRTDSIHPLDDLLARQRREREAQQAMDRYFQGTFNLIRPLPVPAGELTAPNNPRETLDELRAQRASTLATAATFQTAFQQFDEADTHQLQAHCALSLWAANVTPKADHFSFAVGSNEMALAAFQAATERAKRAEPDLSAFEIAATRRFAAALQLLFVPAVAKRLESAEQQQADCRRLLPILQQINAQTTAAIGIRNARTALAVLFERAGQETNSATLIGQIEAQATALHSQLAELLQSLRQFPYPFDHARGPMSLPQFLVEQLPAATEYGALYEAAEEVLDRLASLRHRLLGHLAQIAENVEAAVGLPRLEVPSPRKDDENQNNDKVPVRSDRPETIPVERG